MPSDSNGYYSIFTITDTHSPSLGSLEFRSYASGYGEAIYDPTPTVFGPPDVDNCFAVFAIPGLLYDKAQHMGAHSEKYHVEGICRPNTRTTLYAFAKAYPQIETTGRGRWRISYADFYNATTTVDYLVFDNLKGTIIPGATTVQNWNAGRGDWTQFTFNMTMYS